MQAKNGNAVHIRIEYSDAVCSKKEILQCRASLLEIIKKIRIYLGMRRREFILKNRIKKTLVSIKEPVAKIEGMMPSLREVEAVAGIAKKEQEKIYRLEEIDNITPEDLKEMQLKELEKEKERAAEGEHYADLEAELEDIKLQLDKLSEER